MSVFRFCLVLISLFSLSARAQPIAQRVEVWDVSDSIKLGNRLALWDGSSELVEMRTPSGPVDYTLTKAAQRELNVLSRMRVGSVIGYQVPGERYWRNGTLSEIQAWTTREKDKYVINFFRVRIGENIEDPIIVGVTNTQIVPLVVDVEPKNPLFRPAVFQTGHPALVNILSVDRVQRQAQVQILGEEKDSVGRSVHFSKFVWMLAADEDAVVGDQIETLLFDSSADPLQRKKRFAEIVADYPDASYELFGRVQNGDVSPENQLFWIDLALKHVPESAYELFTLAGRKPCLLARMIHNHSGATIENEEWVERHRTAFVYNNVTWKQMPPLRAIQVVVKNLEFILKGKDSLIDDNLRAIRFLENFWVQVAAGDQKALDVLRSNEVRAALTEIITNQVSRDFVHYNHIFFAWVIRPLAQRAHLDVLGFFCGTEISRYAQPPV